jgi:hypothetical protein
MCHSTDPSADISLHYHMDWGDGETNHGFCRFDHTYTQPGQYLATGCVWDEIPAHAPGQCLTVLFVVTGTGGKSTAACGTNDVSSGGHCYYLDGSGGACDAGYSLQRQEILTTIAPQFVGLNYKHQVSSNCCIENADGVENWGMNANCNRAGPFQPGNPAPGGAGCTNVNPPILTPQQLTLCGK